VTEGMYTPQEIASLLGVSKMTVYRLMNNGVIACVRVGRVIRVPREAYEDFLRTHSSPTWQQREAD